MHVLPYIIQWTVETRSSASSRIARFRHETFTRLRYRRHHDDYRTSQWDSACSLRYRWRIIGRSTENNIVTRVPHILRFFFQMGNCHFLCHCISFNVVIVTANIMLDPRKIFYSLPLWKMHASLEILIYGSTWKTVPSDIRIFSRLLRNDFKLQLILFGQCNSFHDLLS